MEILDALTIYRYFYFEFNAFYDVSYVLIIYRLDKDLIKNV